MKLKLVQLFCAIFIFASVQESLADFTFQGNLDLSEKELNVTVDIPQTNEETVSQEGSTEDHASVSIKAHQLVDGEYHISLDIGHLKTPQFYFSGNIESIFQILELEDSDGRFVKGQWWGENPSVNFETIDNFAGEFKLVKEKLFFKSFALGDVLGQGFVELNPPYNMDFDVRLSSISMNDFLSFWMNKRESDSQGDVTGNIKVKGGLGKLALQGKLESFKGFVRQLEYDSLYLDVEGVYPILEINQESTILKSDGISYSFKGKVDLNDQENLKSQIRRLKISPLVNTTEDGMEWTIKRMEDGDQSTELKYFLRQDTDPSSTDNSDMLGVERSFKF